MGLGPAVERIAPQLTRRREEVRRDASDDPAPSTRVEVKQRPVCPGLGPVVRYVDWDIAEQPYTNASTVFPQGAPLPVEQELLEFGVLYFILQPGRGEREPRGAAVPELPRPVGPGRAAVRLLERAEERIVPKPSLAAFSEVVEGLPIGPMPGCAEPFEGCAHSRFTEAFCPRVVSMPCLHERGRGSDLVRPEPAGFHERLQRHE